MTTPISRPALDGSILKKRQRAPDKDKSFNQSDRSNISFVDPNISEDNEGSRANLPTIAERLGRFFILVLFLFFCAKF